MFSRILKTQCLSYEDAEKNYLNKSKNQKHQIARELICLEIRRYFSLPHAPIAQDTNGEIFLLNSNHKISISHKEENFAVAITNDYESIGVDIENYNSVVDWSVFGGRFFNREDWFLSHQISSLKGISSSQAYSLLFSAKEAVLKASKLKIDPLVIIFTISKNLKNTNQIQLSSVIKYEKEIYYFVTEILWYPMAIKDHPSILSVCVAKKTSDFRNSESSLFNNSQIYIQAPSILF